MLGTDLKIYFLNTGTLLLSMMSIEPILKILLLIVSIGYTINRWVGLYKAKNINTQTNTEL